MKIQLCALLVFSGLLCCCEEIIENNLTYQTRKNGFDKSQHAVYKQGTDIDLDFKIPSWVRTFNNMFYQLCQKFINKKIEKLILKRRQRSVTSPVTPSQSISNSKSTSAVQKIQSYNSSSTEKITVSETYSYLPNLSTTLPNLNHSNLASTNILTINVTSEYETTTFSMTLPTKINQTDQNCTLQNNVIDKMADEKSSTLPEKTKSMIIYLVLAIIIMIFVLGCFIYKQLFARSHRERYQLREMSRIYGEATESKV